MIGSWYIYVNCYDDNDPDNDKLYNKVNLFPSFLRKEVHWYINDSVLYSWHNYKKIKINSTLSTRQLVCPNLESSKRSPST